MSLSEQPFDIEAVQRALEESTLDESTAEPDAPDAPAPAPAVPQPPPLGHSLSSQLTASGQLNDDAIEEVLTKADVPTLLKIKGVSRSWRAGAQRVLRARLCRREAPSLVLLVRGMQPAPPLSRPAWPPYRLYS